jgi:hypothetical protein
MDKQLRDRLVALIDAYGKSWPHSKAWNEGQNDDRSVKVRELWARQREHWEDKVLSMLRTTLLYPDAGPYEPSIADLEKNMSLAGEVFERGAIEALSGDS